MNPPSGSGRRSGEVRIDRWRIGPTALTRAATGVVKPLLAHDRMPGEEGAPIVGFVFVSYARSDAGYVHQLAAHLKRHGIETWHDAQIEPGQSFARLLQDRIDDCAAFLAVLTPESASSTWVAREISYATEIHKPIVPLVLAPCRRPLELIGLQHEDVQDAAMPSDRLLERLRQLNDQITASNDPLPDPEPAVTSYVLAGTLRGHTGPIGTVAYSSDGRRMATGSVDRTVRIWDTATHTSIRILSHDDGPTWPVTFSPDGRQLATAATDAFTVQIWDVATGAFQHTVAHHDEWVCGIAYSPDGTLLATGGGDWQSRIWNCTTGTLERKLETTAQPCWPLTFSPSGDNLAVANFAEPTVGISDTKTGSLRQVLSGHADYVNAIAFSPDGRLIATASNDNTARLWDTTTGAEIQTFLGHTSGVRSIAYSPTGLHIATGGADRTARVWQTATGTQTQELPGQRGKVRSLAYSPNGRYLAIAGGQNVALIWQIS